MAARQSALKRAKWRPVNRLPVSPLISRGLEIAERRLGMAEVCRRFGSPSSAVVAWRLGDAAMPDAQFLVLVDMLLEIDPHWTNRAAGEPPA
jgi:hypothetical protein